MKEVYKDVSGNLQGSAISNLKIEDALYQIAPEKYPRKKRIHDNLFSKCISMIVPGLTAMENLVYNIKNKNNQDKRKWGWFDVAKVEGVKLILYVDGILAYNLKEASNYLEKLL